MLDDRKSQTGAADLLGMALVHAVEALENAFLIRLRDADSGIGDRKDCLLPRACDLHRHGAVFLIIFDRIVTEVIEHLLDNHRNAVHRRGIALERHRDMLALRRRGQLLLDIACNIIEIERQNLFREALVIEARKPDDILDQRDHTRGFITDALGKSADILLFDHTGLHHIGNAVDRSQRRFQLMRDIRCKFAAECVALFALGHIQQNQHRTGQTVIAHNRICDELHRGIIHCNRCRAANAVKRLPDQRAEGLRIAEIIDREIILAGILLPKQLQCRMVIGEHPARCTDKQQTFLHIIRQHLELFLLTGQLVHLCVNLRL